MGYFQKTNNPCFYIANLNLRDPALQLTQNHTVKTWQSRDMTNSRLPDHFIVANILLKIWQAELVTMLQTQNSGKLCCQDRV